MFISIGTNINGNNISTSNDGINWKARGIILNREDINWYSLASNGIIWLVGGDAGGYNTSGANFGLAYSYDTINWIGIDTTLLNIGTIIKIAWNGLNWMILSNGNNNITISNKTNSGDDLIFISKSVSIIQYDITNLAWTGINWIICGGGKPAIAFSNNNGETWVPSNINKSDAWSTIAIGRNPQNICLGGYTDQNDNNYLSNFIITNDGGNTWQYSTMTADKIGNVFSLFWTGNYFIAGGVTNSYTNPYYCMFKSSNGLGWTTITNTYLSPETEQICTITSNGTTLVAGGGYWQTSSQNINPITYSLDQGTTWNNAINTNDIWGSPGQINCIEYHVMNPPITLYPTSQPPPPPYTDFPTSQPPLSELELNYTLLTVLISIIISLFFVLFMI